MSDELEAQIIQRERLLLRPDIRSSREALQKLLAVDFLEIGRSGFLYRRHTVIDALMDEPMDGQIVIDDATVQQLSESVVLLTYRSHRADASAKDRRTTLRSSVWMFVDGDWKMRFHQGTPVP